MRDWHRRHHQRHHHGWRDEDWRNEDWHKEWHQEWEQRRRWLRTPRVRRLQARLFFWFLAAIFIAAGAAVVTSLGVRYFEPSSGPNVATRAIANHLAREWDDPAACEAYVAHVRDLLGIDLRLRRDVEDLPHRAPLGWGAMSMGHHGEAFIPVIRDGALLGALEIKMGMGVAPPLWTGFLVLGTFLCVLGIGARGVARRLAWPLEDVADAAERFGGGDLAARTRLGGKRRWVADEVRGVAQAFDQMAERISRVVRDQRELLAAISHELRSPLGRARVALEIARERGGEATEASIADVEHQLDDVDAILGDLLAAARAGLSDVKPVATPVAAWLRARLAAEIAPPAIELVSDVAEDVVSPLDAPLLNRALHNVLANARAHGHPPDRPIEVSLTATATNVRITARDHGPGFSAELLARVFEPFVKGDTARTPGSGYGLGLALVRRIAEAHGGRAFARNAANADGAGGADGAEVGFELPRSASRGVKID